MSLISSPVTPLNELMCMAVKLSRQLSTKEKTVEKYHVSDEVIKMHRLFEDSDISRFEEVQEASNGMLLSAYYVMVLQDVEPTEANLLKVLRAFSLYAMDESELANSLAPGFMDRCNARKFTSGLLDRIIQEVSNQEIAVLRERGGHVIQIRETRGWNERDCGFYVFTPAAT